MIAQRLKQLREEKRLTQKELAFELSIGSKTISDYERESSSPDNDTLMIIAKFFNVSADYLLGLSDERTPPTTKEKLSGVQLALFNQTENLSEEQMKDVLKYIEFLKAKEGL